MICIHVSSKQIVEEQKFVIIVLSLLGILCIDTLEEWLEIEPAIKALVLIFTFYHAQEVTLCDVLQLNMLFVLTSRRSNLYPFIRVVAGAQQILMLADLFSYLYV